MIVITTIAKHQKTSYRDIINADIVIVSFAILRNRNYLTTEATCHPSYLETATSDWDPAR